MGEQFDASRPIYAQLVERLKARILAGTYPPGGHLDSVRDLAAAAGDTALSEQLRADTARTLASDFLEKMRGIGYSPAQTAALLEHWDAKEDRNE